VPYPAYNPDAVSNDFFLFVSGGPKVLAVSDYLRLLKRFRLVIIIWNTTRYTVSHKCLSYPIRSRLREILLHSLCWASDVVFVHINNLCQSFDAVPKNLRDCVRCESAQDFVDHLKKPIDLADLPRNELAFEPSEEKEVRWCDIMAKRRMDDVLEAQFFHSGQVPF
jgi:hypothetical protein